MSPMKLALPRDTLSDVPQFFFGIACYVFLRMFRNKWQVERGWELILKPKCD